MALKGLGTGKQGVNYEQHLKTKPVSGIVSSEKSVKGQKIGQSSSQTQVIHPGVFTSGFSITVEGGRVMNLGNYETARVGVSITVPCEKNSLDEAYKFAQDWISDKIEEALKDAKS